MWVCIAVVQCIFSSAECKQKAPCCGRHSIIAVTCLSHEQNARKESSGTKHETRHSPVCQVSSLSPEATALNFRFERTAAQGLRRSNGTFWRGKQRLQNVPKIESGHPVQELHSLKLNWQQNQREKPGFNLGEHASRHVHVFHIPISQTNVPFLFLTLFSFPPVSCCFTSRGWKVLDHKSVRLTSAISSTWIGTVWQS